jgi:hypothetical protein
MHFRNDEETRGYLEYLIFLQYIKISDLVPFLHLLEVNDSEVLLEERLKSLPRFQHPFERDASNSMSP